jgi:hypothetical protein
LALLADVVVVVAQHSKIPWILKKKMISIPINIKKKIDDLHAPIVATVVVAAALAVDNQSATLDP